MQAGSRGQGSPAPSAPPIASKHWAGAFTQVQRLLRFSFVVAFFMPALFKSFAAPVMLLALAVSLLAFALPTRAIVGADGLLLRWLFLRRFVPFSIIEHVSLAPVVKRDKAGNRTTSGQRLEIETSEGPSVAIDVGTDSRGLFDAVVAARRSYHARTHGPFDLRALRPEGNDVASWIARLRGLSGRVRSFRVDAPSQEELLALVEDPVADEEARAAAAVVLSSSQDEGARERVRIARDATASPKLRVALDAAYDGQEDALGPALDAVRLRAQQE